MKIMTDRTTWSSNPLAIAVLSACSFGACGQNVNMIVTAGLGADSLTVGQPIIVSLTFRHNVAQEVFVDLGRYYEQNLSVVLADPTGQVTPRRWRVRDGGFSPAGRIVVPAGKTVRKDYDASDWFPPLGIGSYRLKINLPPLAETEGGQRLTIIQPDEVSISVEPRDTGRLRAVCDRLLAAVGQADNSEGAILAASALSHVADPIAIPYLVRAAQSNQVAYTFAVSGMGRFHDSAEAVQGLILFLRSGGNLASMARGALESLEGSTNNAELKVRIHEALALQ